MPGVPRVADHRHRRAAGHRGHDALEPRRFVVPVQRRADGRPRAHAVMPMAESRARFGACPRSRRGPPWPARHGHGGRDRPGSRSAWPRARVGPAAPRSRPVARWTVRHLAHLELVTHPHAPTLQRAGLGLDGAAGPAPTTATRHGLSRVTRTTVQVDGEKGHVDGEFHAHGVHGAHALEVERALASRCAPAGRPRSVAESVISSAHTTSPSRSSHPDRMPREATGRPWRTV